MKYKYYILLLLAISSFTLSECKYKQEEIVLDDFDAILAKDTLTIITLNTSTSYFIYKEEPMGYDYELARDFCKSHNIELKVKVAGNTSQLLTMLNNKEGDLIAYPFSVQNDLRDEIIYAGVQQISHQVLVQRANKGDTILKDVTELVGKEVFVLQNTKYHQRLMNLDAELGGGIKINSIDKDTIIPEDLIEMVASGKIRYTVSDEYIAKLNRTYYRNINISLPISFDQRTSWATRKDSPTLARILDEWFAENDNTPTYRGIIKRYYELSKQSFDEEYEAPKGLPKGTISPYDDLFKQHAKGSPFEWQMIAAISYHESRFQNNLTSWAGASGIMGLMPVTAQSLGLKDEDRMNPDLSIGAAVDLLEVLNNIFRRVSDPHERIKLILASYNGGIGHINDAQALARKYGADPYIWEGNVKKYLELKNHPDYYNDSICKNGYFRAGETIRYVNLVLKTTDRFKRLTK